MKQPLILMRALVDLLHVSTCVELMIRNLVPVRGSGAYKLRGGQGGTAASLNVLAQ